MTPEQYIRTHLPEAPRVSSLEKLSSWVASRSIALVVGGVAGALLTASIGVSAHTGALPIFQPADEHQTVSDQPVQGSGAAVATKVGEALDTNEATESDEHPAGTSQPPAEDVTHQTAVAKPTHRPTAEPWSATHKDE
ncbi:MAG: hypothetical protein ACHQ0J_00780 [Candidatus Dormibacterales bacterium]